MITIKAEVLCMFIARLLSAEAEILNGNRSQIVVWKCRISLWGGFCQLYDAAIVLHQRILKVLGMRIGQDHDLLFWRTLLDEDAATPRDNFPACH